jgi:hypothetical protein
MYTQGEIRVAVADEYWQSFRKSLKGTSTETKLEKLREYLEEQFGTRKKKVQVDNYIKALCRGGQLPRGTSLDVLIANDWQVKILK